MAQTNVARAQRQVTLTDFIFTAGGVVVELATGVGNATIHGMDYVSIRWLACGYWLFIISGVLWVAVLIPVQIWQAKLTRRFAQGGEIPDVYWTLGSRRSGSSRP